jgi:hypothetical protein
MKDDEITALMDWQARRETFYTFKVTRHPEVTPPTNNE